MSNISTVLLVMGKNTIISNCISLPAIKTAIFHSLSHGIRNIILPTFTQRIVIILQRLIINRVSHDLTILTITTSLIIIDVLSIW